MNEISALRKQAPEAPSPLLPCEARRWPSVNQEAGSHQTLDLLVPGYWTSQPPELW